MNIIVNKESMEDLVKYAGENIDFLSTVIAMHISDDELAGVLEGKLHGILYYICQAYNPELMELKHQSTIYYQKWLSFKDTDKNVANRAFLEYLNLKRRIEITEMPF